MKAGTTFKDPWRKMTYMKEKKTNKIIEDTIRASIKTIKSQNEEPKNIETKNVYEDKFPYCLLGLVVSTFVNEKKMEKYKEFGLGIVLDENIVLVNSKNLIFDRNNITDDAEGEFILLDLEFSLLNISKEKSDYLPKKIKVSDYFCPIEDNMSDEEILVNNWGLLILDLSVGNFVHHSSNEKVQLSFLNNEDINSTEILFLEIMKEIETFKTFENFYEMKFDDYLIFLKNLDKKEHFLPGVILGSNRGRISLIGMNTNIKVKLGEELADTKENLTRLAIRFDEKILRAIQNKIYEIKSLTEVKFSAKLFNLFDKEIQTLDSFNNLIKDNCKNLFILCRRIKESKACSMLNKEEKDSLEKDFPNDVIKHMFSLIWNKLNANRKENKSSSRSINLEGLNIGIGPGTEIISHILSNLDSLSILNLKQNYIFAKGLKSLIKPIFNTKQIILLGAHLKVLNLESNKLSSKAMKYLCHVLKISPELETLHLNHNYICAKGLKYLKHSMEGKPKLTLLGLAYNMLGKTSGKDLADILRVIPNLQTLRLESNNLTDESLIVVLTRLSETTDEKGHSLKNLFLGNNNLTLESASILAQWLEYNSNLEILWLNNNNLSDDGGDVITKSLDNEKKQNSLIELNLSNVNLNPEGAVKLFNNLTKNSSLKKLNLSFNNITDSPCEALADLLKSQRERNEGFFSLSLNNCEIKDLGAELISSELINHPSLKEIKLNSNSISDKGGEVLLYSVLENPLIQSFHFENNMTKWRLYNLDIKNARSNLQIFFN